jgi:hypothetical protein
MAPDVAQPAEPGVVPVLQPVRLLDVPHRQTPASPHGVEPSEGQVTGKPRDVLAVIHA